MEENNDSKENIKKKKKANNKWIAILVSIIIGLTISIFFFNEGNRRKVSDFLDSLGNSEKELSLIYTIEDDNILDMAIYENGLAIWKENKISFINLQGELIWEKDFDFTQASIHYGENLIYPYDKATGSIYFLGKDGETSNTVKLKKEIFNIKESNGNLLCHSKTEGKETLDILDENRVSIGSMDFEGKNILSYDINQKATRALVSLLNLDENKLKSEVYNYDESNEKTGSTTIEEEIVLFSELDSRGGQVILTDSGLYYLKDSEIMWEREFNLIKDIYVEDKIYLLHGNYLESMDFKGETIKKTGFTEGYSNIIKFHKSTLAYGDENLSLVKNGELILEHEEPILKAYTNGSEIVVLGPEMVNIYEAINKE